MSDAARPSNRSTLGLVFLTAFLDMAGFSILFPLFPQLLGHYLALEGEQSLLGRGVAALSRWAGEGADADFLVVALFGGVLGALYSTLQFLFAPVWGAVSDRFGRRPTLLFTLAGTCLAYVLWFFAGSFAFLIASRLFAGLMAGNIATASAVVADVTLAQERSKGMGLLGAGIGLGFIFGPVLGGLTAHLDLSQTWPGAAAWGVNPFSAAALTALVLSLVNLLWASARLPETLPRERRGTPGHVRSVDPRVLFGSAAAGRGVARVNLIYFLAFTAFGAAEFTLVFLAVERFGYTPRDNAWMFVFVGLTIALVQGGAIRRLAPRHGDRRLALAGLVTILPSFVLIALAQSPAVLYPGLFLMAVGSALIVPSLSALASRHAPPERQGLALGTFRSVGSLARALGPLAGGLLYWRLGSASPYLAAAVLVLLPTWLAVGLSEPPSDPSHE